MNASRFLIFLLWIGVLLEMLVIAFMFITYAVTPIITMMTSREISYPYYYTVINIVQWYTLGKLFLISEVICAGGTIAYVFIDLWLNYRRKTVNKFRILLKLLLTLLPLTLGVLFLLWTEKITTLINYTTHRCLIKTLNSNGTLLYIYNKTCVSYLISHE